MRTPLKGEGLFSPCSACGTISSCRDFTERGGPITAIEMRPIHLCLCADNYTNFSRSLPIQIDSHKGMRVDVMKHSHCQVRGVKARVLAAGKSEGMEGKRQRLANCATTDFMLEMKPIMLFRGVHHQQVRARSTQHAVPPEHQIKDSKVVKSIQAFEYFS